MMMKTITMTMTMTMTISLMVALLLAYSNTSSFVSSFSITPVTTTAITTTTSTPPSSMLTPLQQWNPNSNSNPFSSSTSSFTSSSSVSSKHPSSSSALLLLADNNGVTDTSTTSSLAAVGSVLSSKNSNSNSNNNNLVGTNKLNFLNSLDTIDTLNDATKERTTLLNKMINEKLIVNVNNEVVNVNESINEENEHNKNEKESIIIVPTMSYNNPGSSETFLKSSTSSSSTETNTNLQSAPNPIPIAVGKWKVIYAPHISTAANILHGKFDVQYDLFYDIKDGSTVVSHAYYDFPIIGKGYLSVSGTYGSVLADSTSSEYYSKVDFNKAWIKPIFKSKSQEEDESQKQQPYANLKDVPDSMMKTIINEIGKRAFVESVAVFPVSFLDANMIVFEFQLFGTKICAYKQ